MSKWAYLRSVGTDYTFPWPEHIPLCRKNNMMHGWRCNKYVCTVSWIKVILVSTDDSVVESRSMRSCCVSSLFLSFSLFLFSVQAHSSHYMSHVVIFQNKVDLAWKLCITCSRNHFFKAMCNLNLLFLFVCMFTDLQHIVNIFKSLDRRECQCSSDIGINSFWYFHTVPGFTSWFGWGKQDI